VTGEDAGPASGRGEAAGPADGTRETADGTRDPAAAVRAIVAAAGDHVAPLLSRVEERLVAVAGAHGPPLDVHAGETIAAGGKRLRPLLVLLAAGPEPADEGRLVRAAVAVELVHSATLVHDDVLDEAPLRRGRPTVVASAGPGIATATGDLLFSRAFAELAAPGSLAEGVQTLSAASSALARGELLQREDAWAARVTVDRYLERCELKTACLFKAACELGALEAGDGHEDALGVFGRRVGLAFQILDDVLDVAGPAQRTGKHRGTDLLDGTVTLPLILARERDPAVAATDLRSVRTAQQAEAVCDAVIASGALGEARERALFMVAEAKAGLPVLPAAQHRALELVADSVVERYA
jgi:geranylgeranyl pyrophosphate synthase